MLFNSGLLRCGKSCRLRWINYLRPDLKRGNFAEDEEDLIIKLHALLGNRCDILTLITIPLLFFLFFLVSLLWYLSYKCWNKNKEYFVNAITPQSYTINLTRIYYCYRYCREWQYGWLPLINPLWGL